MYIINTSSYNLEYTSNFNLPYVPLLYHNKADCLCSEVLYQMMGRNFLW